MTRFALTDAISELLEVPIPERGVNFMTQCPLHEDRSPSFSIHLDEGVWHCFGCEERGTINQLYKKLGVEVGYDVRFAQAKKMAERPIVQTHNFAAIANAQIDHLRQSRAAQRSVRDFLDAKGIRADAVGAFGIGFDGERQAISFPYADQTGRVTGIKYRYVTGFKASESGSSYGLYGVNHAVGKEQVIICEGESDTLATWSRYGNEYGVCGTSGASVSDTQWSRFGIHLLFARRIFLLYDADTAGDKCAETAMSVLGSDKCIRLRPPEDRDASELYSSGGTLEGIGLVGAVLA